MRRVLSTAMMGMWLSIVPAFAVETASNTDLIPFRTAYTTGDGLAYVVISDEKGENLYRYGDASRLAAKKDERGYMLFTCLAPHVFLPDSAADKSQLLKAKIVKQGDPEYSALDAKYVGGCKNPFVKSALPK